MYPLLKPRARSRRAHLLESGLLGLLSVFIGCNAMAQEDGANAAPSASPTLIIMGASYAGDWGVNRLGPYRVENKGIGGEQTPATLGRFEADAVLPAPDAVLLWGFINNVFRAPDGQYEQAVEQMKADYERMVQMSLAHGIRPIIATEVTMGMRKGFKEKVMGLVASLMGKTSYQERINAHVQAGNEWLREFADKKGLLLLDFERELADEDGMRRPDYVTEDGSHVSAAAYDVLAAYTDGRLAEAGLSRR